jgi:hypothetical protein
VNRCHCFWCSARWPVVPSTGMTTVGRGNRTAGTLGVLSCTGQIAENANEDFQKEDISMFLNQRLGGRKPIGTEVANQLAHVESELCWCDPIVETDEYGQKVVMHKEVTWH